MEVIKGQRGDATFDQGEVGMSMFLKGKVLNCVDCIHWHEVKSLRIDCVALSQGSFSLTFENPKRTVMHTTKPVSRVGVEEQTDCIYSDAIHSQIDVPSLLLLHLKCLPFSWLPWLHCEIATWGMMIQDSFKKMCRYEVEPDALFYGSCDGHWGHFQALISPSLGNELCLPTTTEHVVSTVST
jgi:hypothetical protein